MTKFDSYMELVLEEKSGSYGTFDFLGRCRLWQKAKELKMTVADIRACEVALEQYEKDQKAAKKAREEAAEAERHRLQELLLPLTTLLENGLAKFPDKDLFIGKTQVTQALWKLIIGENPSYFKGDDRPVESISLGDCERFISTLNAREEVINAKLAFRLPTPEEWHQFNKQNDYKGSQNAWVWDNSNCETHSVGQKGEYMNTYDMYGNVSEWCVGGFCMGGNFLSGERVSYLCEEDQYDENTKLPIIGLRLLARKI